MDDPDVLRRRIVHSLLSNICLNHGFENIEVTALETLSEMFTSYISQLSIQTKLYAELQGRTEPTLHDLATAFIELGVDLRSLYKYMHCLKSQKINKVTPPSIATIPKPPQVLHAIKPRQHFSHIYDHFPAFPDPHSYISQPTFHQNQPDRELLAEQKLNIEKALIKFRLRKELLLTSSIKLSIFKEDTQDTTFMLISADEVSETSEDPPHIRSLLAK